MNKEKLNALKERAYKTAVEHGFHEKEMSDAFYLGLVMSEAGEALAKNPAIRRELDREALREAKRNAD